MNGEVIVFAVMTDDDIATVRFFEHRPDAYGEATERAQHHMIQHDVSVICRDNPTWTTILTLAEDRRSVTITCCQPCKDKTCTRHGHLWHNMEAVLWANDAMGVKPSMQSPGTHPMDVMHR